MAVTSAFAFSTAISWGLCQVNMQGLEEAVLKGEGVFMPVAESGV